MKYSENDSRDDLVSEIKGSLDREVAWRFDSEKYAADHVRMIERLEMERRMARLRARSGSAARPFARVPVPLQWLGLAASIIAAAVGIRSLYRGWSAPAAVERVASAPVASEVAPGRASPDLPSVPDTAQAVPSPVAPPVAPQVEERERRREGVGSRESAPPRDSSSASPSGMPAPTYSPPATPSAATAPERPRPDPLPPREPTVVASGSGNSGAMASPLPNDATRYPTGAPSSGTVLGAAPVRVASQRLLEQGFLAEVREIPQLQATLIGIRGRGEFHEAQDDDAKSDQGESGLPTERPSPGLPEGSDGSRGDPLTNDPEEEFGAEAEAERDDASSGKDSPGAFYVRAFLGVNGRGLDSEGGYLGRAITAVTLPDREAWGTYKQQSTLQSILGMRIVAIDGAFLAAASGEETSSGSVILAAAERVYEVALKGERAQEGTDVHAMSVLLTRRNPEGSGARRGSGIEVPIQVRNGAVAVVCVGEPLLSPERERANRARVMVLCVAVSPRFGDLRRAPELGPFGASGHGHEPPIVIERPDPLYPEAARELGVKGEVLVDFTVLKDGRVYGVHVASLPRMRGAELLIEPASSVVRHYRFLPARIHGEPVDAVVRTKVRFGRD